MGDAVAVAGGEAVDEFVCEVHWHVEGEGGLVARGEGDEGVVDDVGPPHPGGHAAGFAVVGVGAHLGGEGLVEGGLDAGDAEVLEAVAPGDGDVLLCYAGVRREERPEGVEAEEEVPPWHLRWLRLSDWWLM